MEDDRCPKVVAQRKERQVDERAIHLCNSPYLSDYDEPKHCSSCSRRLFNYKNCIPSGCPEGNFVQGKKAPLLESFACGLCPKKKSSGSI